MRGVLYGDWMACHLVPLMIELGDPRRSESEGEYTLSRDMPPLFNYIILVMNM